MLHTAFSILVILPLCVCSQDPQSNDVFGLIAFKSDLTDPNLNLSSWNADSLTACKWTGVKCDRRNRVRELSLDGFGLSGRIGRGLFWLDSLRNLSLSKNNFSGSLAAELGNLTSLQSINLSGNNFSGTVPDGLFQQCRSLREISLAGNCFSGGLPLSLPSCSSLISVNFSSNKLTGGLPENLWSIARLQSLDLSDNLLEGEIPGGIERLLFLRVINLRRNKLSGTIPDGIGKCLSLRSVDFSENSFSGSLPTSVRNLTLCKSLSLRSNLFAGELPAWLGEMIGIENFDLSNNHFMGEIPEHFGRLRFLSELNLSQNELTGNISASLHGCKKLEKLDLSYNSLTGYLPGWMKESVSENSSTGGVQTHAYAQTPFPSNLVVLDLSSNLFSGGIPNDIGDLSRLKLLNLSSNSLQSEIPRSIGDLQSVEALDFSLNQLYGSIPSNIGGATALKEIRLQNNSLTGKIPEEIGDCSSLTSLLLSHNHLTGALPPSMAQLKQLKIVDLSTNNLTGSIPKNLGELIRLTVFNISYNHFSGRLPTSPFFNTMVSSSVMGNPSLCGAIMNHSCPGVMPKPIVLDPGSAFNPDSTSHSPSNSRHKKAIFSISALVAIGAAVVIALGVVLVTLLNLQARNSAARAAASRAFSGTVEDDDYSGSPVGGSNSGKLVMFSGEPEFSAGTHALLNKDCELGRGGFGAVYRTILCDGRAVAIKKLTISSLVKSQEDFEREVRKLGKISHPNLVQLEGYYWTASLQLLIYEFIAGGSLHAHLHETSDSSPILSWTDRFNIIVGIARGLYTLHRANLIHYNLKSSNVLLDESRQPKVGDYGLAKLLPVLDRYILSSKIQSALGYMAPEFACQTVKITQKSDVYTFGVLTLEIVTGRRPVEYMEDDVVVLCDMVREALEEDRVEDCVDPHLGGEYFAEEAIPVMKLALVCTSQVPSSRPDMDEVLRILEVFKVKNFDSPIASTS